MDKQKKWKKLSSESVFDHKYFKVNKDIVELPGGRKIDWFYWNSKDSVMVVALTPEKKLVMIEQYRYLPDLVALEFPAGRSEEGETMKQAGERELEEETGYECEGLQLLGSFYETMSQVNRKIHIYYAQNARPLAIRKRNPDDNEEIEVKLIDFEDAVKQAKENKIISMGTTLAILLLDKKFKEGK